jgi:hypothetical protein
MKTDILIRKIEALQGFNKAEITEDGLIIQVQASHFVGPYGWTKHTKDGRKLAQRQINFIEDQTVVDLVNNILIQTFPKVFARLEWSADYSRANTEDTVTITIKTTLKRKLPYETSVCYRCKGSGEFSFNNENGTICFGCGGVKRNVKVKASPVFNLIGLKPGDGPVMYRWTPYQALEDGSVIRLADGAPVRIDSSGNATPIDEADRISVEIVGLDLIDEWDKAAGKAIRRSERHY